MPGSVLSPPQLLALIMAFNWHWNPLESELCEPRDVRFVS